MRSSDEAILLHSYGLHAPTRTIEFTGEVDEHSVAKLIRNLHLLDSLGSAKPITILMNSLGGDVQDGLAAYDAIRACKSDVHIRVVGAAHSIAAWILQAADLRQMAPHATLMFHEGTTTEEPAHPQEVKAGLKYWDMLDDWCVSVLMERLTLRDNGRHWTENKVRNKIRFAWYLTATQAIAEGLADEVYP